MRIAVDASPLGYRITGIGRYTLCLLRELLSCDEHEWFLYSNRPVLADLPKGEHIHLRCPDSRPLIPGPVSRQWLYPRWSRQDRIDVFWATAQHLPLFLPGRIRRVLTVHDLVWSKYPETMSFRGRLVDRLLIPRGIEVADEILTVSELTAEALLRERGVGAERLTVTRLAPTALDESESPELIPALAGARYILFVGTLEPRKNLGALATAFSELAPENPDMKLVICGPRGWGDTLDPGRLEELGIAESTLLTGYVTDRQLHGLYRHCALLAMPSLYEGFGLPALEALGHARPVVVSRNTAIASIESPLVHVCEDTGAGAILTAIRQALAMESGVTAPELPTWRDAAAATLRALVG